MNMYYYNETYNNVCTYARRSAPLCTDVVGGAYGGRWASDGVHHVHAHLVGLGGVCRTLCTVLRTISDLGGGVNGNDVNLRDKCGVCDDVTG